MMLFAGVWTLGAIVTAALFAWLVHFAEKR